MEIFDKKNIIDEQLFKLMNSKNLISMLINKNIINKH